MSDSAPPPHTFDYVSKPPPRDWRLGPKAAVVFMFFVWLLVGNVFVVLAKTVTQALTPPRHFTAATVRDTTSDLLRRTDIRQARAELVEASRKIVDEARERLSDRSADVTIEFGHECAYLLINANGDETAAATAALAAVGNRIGSRELAQSEVSSGQIDGSRERFAKSAAFLAAGLYLTLTLLWLRRRMRPAKKA